MTKLHEEFWRGTLGEANGVFFMHQPNGELTILIEGQANSKVEPPSDIQLESELRKLIASGESLSTQREGANRLQSFTARKNSRLQNLGEAELLKSKAAKITMTHY